MGATKDPSDGLFKWLDGSNTTNLEDRSWRSNSSDTENCLAIYSVNGTARLVEIKCSETIRPLCQYKIGK